MAGPDLDVLAELLRRVSEGDAAAPGSGDGESDAAQAAGGLLAWSEDPPVAWALAEAGFVDVAARLLNEASSDMLMARVAGTLATAAAAEGRVAPKVGNSAALLAGCEAALQYSGDPDLLAEASRLVHTVSACVRRAAADAPVIADAWTDAALRRLPRLMAVALRAQHETLVGRIVGLAHHLLAVSPAARAALAGQLRGLRWARAMLLCQRRALLYADRGPEALLGVVAALSEAGEGPAQSLDDAVELAFLCAKLACSDDRPQAVLQAAHAIGAIASAWGAAAGVGGDGSLAVVCAGVAGGLRASGELHAARRALNAARSGQAPYSVAIDALARAVASVQARA